MSEENKPQMSAAEYRKLQQDRLAGSDGPCVFLSDDEVASLFGTPKNAPAPKAPQEKDSGK